MIHSAVAESPVMWNQAPNETVMGTEKDRAELHTVIQVVCYSVWDELNSICAARLCVTVSGG